MGMQRGSYEQYSLHFFAIPSVVSQLIRINCFSILLRIAVWWSQLEKLSIVVPLTCLIVGSLPQPIDLERKIPRRIVRKMCILLFLWLTWVYIVWKALWKFARETNPRAWKHKHVVPRLRSPTWARSITVFNRVFVTSDGAACVFSTAFWASVGQVPFCSVSCGMAHVSYLEIGWRKS